MQRAKKRGAIDVHLEQVPVFRRQVEHTSLHQEGVFWARAEPAGVKLIVRRWAPWGRLRNVSAWDELHRPNLRQVRESRQVDDEVDDQSEAAQQHRMVCNQRDDLVEVEVLRLGWRLDVILVEIRALTARPVVEAICLEEGVLRLL